MGKRELVALLNLFSWCLVMAERLFLVVPWGCLRFVIVVFPDHTHILFLLRKQPKKHRSLTRTTVSSQTKTRRKQLGTALWINGRTNGAYSIQTENTFNIDQKYFQSLDLTSQTIEILFCNSNLEPVTQLKDYRQKLGQVESNGCECGEVENMEHFLLECQLYDDHRLELLHTLQSQLGITCVDALELLSYKDRIKSSLSYYRN